MSSRLSRREMLRSALLAGAGLALAACQPKVVEVEKVVKETVEVEKEVEKVVKETVVVEKQVEVAAAPKSKVTITVQSKSGNMVGVQDCFDAFNGSQDWVTVEASLTTHDKMMVGWATGTGPDWIRCDPIELDYPVSVDALTPIQPFVDRDGITFDWLYDVVKPWLYYPIKDGPAFMVPWTGGSFVVYYNRDHFEEVGIAEPSPDWTWDDYGTIAQQLTKVDADGMPLRFGSFDWPQMWWNSWLIPLLQAGGVPFDHPLWGLADFDDPDFLGDSTKALPGYSKEAMKQALQMQFDLIYKYEACPRPGYELPEGTGFLSGNMSMNFGTAAYASQIIRSDAVTNWGVVPPPKAPSDEGRHATQAYLAGFALGSHCAEKDAAWEAMKFFMSQGARKCIFTSSDEWPWPKDLEEWLKSQPGMDSSYENALVFNSTKDAVFIPPVPDFNRFFNEALDPYSDLVFNQEMSVDDAVEQMEKEGDAVLRGL